MRYAFLLLCLLPFNSFCEKVFIQGNILNPPDEIVVLSIDKTFLGFQPDSYTAKTKDGKFSFSFELDRERVAGFTFKKQTVQFYLQPGDNLTVTFDASDFPSSLQFSGKGSDDNNFLKDLNLKFPEPDTGATKTLIQKSSVDEFESKAFDFRKQRQDFYSNYPDKGKLSADFKSYIENQIRYQYYAQMLGFAIWKDQSGDGLGVNSLPGIMLDGIGNLEISSEKNIISSAYRNFLLNYITYYTAHLNKFQKFENHSALLDRKYNLAMKGLNGEPLRYALAQNLYDFCEITSPETVKKLFMALTEADAEGKYVKIVSEKCTKPLNAKEPKKPKEDTAEAKKSKGEPKYPFEMVDLQGNKVSLDDFRGKVLYVDFWASWCGPCRQQFPHSKELHNMLTKQQLKEVVFLYISIDNSEDAWKGAVEKFEIEGFNALSPGGWSSGAATFFQVSSIPRYMLIDKQGNIADPNAKRPSSREEILNDILKLLE